MGQVDIEAEMAKMMELKLTEISRKQYGDLIKTGMTLKQATDVISSRSGKAPGRSRPSTSVVSGPRKQFWPETPDMESEEA